MDGKQRQDVSKKANITCKSILFESFIPEVQYSSTLPTYQFTTESTERASLTENKIIVNAQYQ